MLEFWRWPGIDVPRASGALLTSFVAALLITPLVIKVARNRGLVAKPSAERWHTKPTALMGGVAIFVAAFIGAVLFLPVASANLAFVGTGVGALFIFFIGLYDDYRPLRPATKLIAQLVTACFFVAIFQNSLNPPTYGWLVPFAIIWVVGITNAFNLLDNMDGLAAGVAMLVAFLMAAHAAVMGDGHIVISALIIAGAAGGFLVYNFNPAKIFMGDAGSMFLGFSLACLSLMGKSGLLSGNLFTALMMPTLILATPLFDTTFVSLVRVLHGRSISQGGRDHTSHRLVLLGLSERRAVIWLYCITLWFGLIALWGASIQNWLGTVAITMLSVIALLVLGLFLAEVQTYSEEEYARVRARDYDGKTVLSRVVKHKRRFVEALLDFGLVCACWIAAYLLKFGVNLDGHARDLAQAMPYVVACQITALYVTGLYRGMWRYMTISDMGAALRGVIFGSMAAYALLKLFAPFQPSLPSILVIDTVLLLVAVIGMRMGLKVLRYHFALQWREGLRRVLVVGAGDAGELAVREMFNNKTLQLQPVGFLDDDPLKQHASIHGIRVLGTRRQLLDVVNRLKVDEVVIAMPSIGNGVVQEMIDTCDQNGIIYREMRGVIL